MSELNGIEFPQDHFDPAQSAAQRSMMRIVLCRRMAALIPEATVLEAEIGQPGTEATGEQGGLDG